MDHDLDTYSDDSFTDDLLDERICQNCSYFFHHFDDDDCLGICSLDKDFGSYWDDENLTEKMDFSSCRDLYLKKCFEGLREACESFENSMIDIPEGMSVETYLRIEAMRDADTSELFQYLNQPDREIALRALDQIRYFACKGNMTAYTNLIRYCQELGPATTLEEVGFRIEIVGLLSFMPRNAQIIDVYIQELARTPSNNMTRKLYTKILRELGRYPQEEIRAPLEKLLNQVPYSYKIKRRISEVAGLVETEDTGWF